MEEHIYTNNYKRDTEMAETSVLKNSVAKINEMEKNR